MNGHGLSRQTVQQIQDVLAHFPEVGKATLFGSRAKGLAKDGSDIDLALYGEGLDWRVLGRIEDELGELLLPYNFSLLHHGIGTDVQVAAHIARVGVLFYRCEGATAAAG